MEKPQAKLVSASVVSNYFKEIFPSDLNALNTVFGGAVLATADKVAGFVAMTHSQENCVTLGMDSVRFLAPARQGETLIYKASMNKAWGTSMEVGVKVFSRNMKTSLDQHIFSAYFTFVAVDADNKRVPVPSVIPETHDEKRRYQEAETRRTERLAKNK